MTARSSAPLQRLLCDFDGTLVDSSESILETLRSCLSRLGLQAQAELSSALIGPPLRSMVLCVLGPAHAGRAPELEAAFREEYDRLGHLRVQPYPGIVAVLRELQALGVELHLVTNKRSVPTRLVLERLGWSAWFCSVNTLDSALGARTKSDVVARMSRDMGWNGGGTALVGDSKDDADAARLNGIAFAWAGWGYGSSAGMAGAGVKLAAPEDLLGFAAAVSSGAGQPA